jgi:hypothetical protein
MRALFCEEGMSMSESESFTEQVSRVRMMAEDDGETWDLSDNDKAALRAVLAKLAEPVGGASPAPGWQDDYKALYHELLYEVVKKHPGESRHQTAKRYIREHETPSDHQAKAAGVSPPPETGR